MIPFAKALLRQKRHLGALQGNARAGVIPWICPACAHVFLQSVGYHNMAVVVPKDRTRAAEFVPCRGQLRQMTPEEVAALLSL
jgi:hypothetical protein